MQYSNFDMKNNVHATLSTAISSVATTIQLTSWQWSRFWTTFPQIATLESIENWKVMKREIVKITWRSGDNLTVVRAFAPCPENDDANSQTQSSISFNADDTISLYIPKEIFDIIKKSLNDIYDNGTNNLRTELVSWLEVEVNAWPVLVWSAYYDFAGWTITLTDNATNYLEIDEDWNLANNTSDWNEENTKLAIITTSGGSVTNIKDRRLWTVWWKIGGVNIHELTEKLHSNWNDEILIADSENIFQNKKIKVSNFWWIWNFGAWEQIDAGDVIYQEKMISWSDVNSFLSVWFSSNVQKISLMRIWNWQDFSSMKLYLAKNWTPTNNLTIRIETNDNWNPSWNLIDWNATATIDQTDLTTTPTETTINFWWTINIPQWTVCFVVLSQWVVDTTNFYKIWWKEFSPNLFKIKQYDWSVWNNYQEYWSYFTLSTATQSTWTYTLLYSSKPYFWLSRNWKYLFQWAQARWQMQWHTLSTNWLLSSVWSSNWYVSQPQWPIIANDDWKIVLTTRRWSYARQLQRRSMSTAWNPNTASGGDVVSLRTLLWMTSSSDDNIQWMNVNWDWTKIYFCYKNIIREYSMWSARNPTTLTATWKTVSVDTWWQFCFSPDWKNIYINASSWTYCTIWRYQMSTARDITTAVKTTDQLSVTWSDPWQVQIHPTEPYLIFSEWQTLKKYYSPNLIWNNSLVLNNCDGLQEVEIWKASASDTSKIPPIPMISKWDFEIWNTVVYDIDVNNKQSWLTIWQKYYLSDTPWEIQTTAGTNEFEVWIAIEPTILKLKQTY